MRGIAAIAICAVLFFAACSPAEEDKTITATVTVKEETDRVIKETPVPDPTAEPTVEPTPTAEPTAEPVVEDPVEYVEEPVEEPVEAECTDDLEQMPMTYYGNCVCTWYIETGCKCANGNYPQVWYSVANNELPFGTQIYIEGLGFFVVEDRGSHDSIETEKWIDLYVGTMENGYSLGWGEKSFNVYILE